MANRYELSASEIRDMTKWPDVMVDDYLSRADQLQELEEDASSVRGEIDSAGAIVSGSRFTPAKTGTGIYTVTFSVEKASADYVVLANAANDNHVCNYAAKSTTGFTIRISSSGALSDSAFNFMVKKL
jgi:hypothetical protein